MAVSRALNTKHIKKHDRLRVINMKDEELLRPLSLNFGRLILGGIESNRTFQIERTINFKNISKNLKSIYIVDFITIISDSSKSVLCLYKSDLHYAELISQISQLDHVSRLCAGSVEQDCASGGDETRSNLGSIPIRVRMLSH